MFYLMKTVTFILAMRITFVMICSLRELSNFTFNDFSFGTVVFCSTTFCLSLFFQGKLVKYFSRQLSYKRKVPLQERNVELDGFPRLGHWFRIVNIRKEVIEV